MIFSWRMVNYIERAVLKSIYRKYHCIASMSVPFSKATEARKAELIEAYDKVHNEVQRLASEQKREVTLIAVSKYKPASDILALYEHGVRHFGENYVQELISKAEELPKDIKWHFIGGLQTGKCKDLSKKIDNLYSVETIDSLKKCKKLNETRKSTDFGKVNVFLQINTSGEDQKSGYNLQDLSDIFSTIEFLLNKEECTSLSLKGLMTIGSFSSSISRDHNPDFAKLLDLKKSLDKKYGISLETSMGMSNDYVEAISQGSSNVRVGSSIFGSRPLKAE